MLKSHERSAIVLLHERGHSIGKIKKLTGHDRKSIRNILREAASSNAPSPDTKRHSSVNYAWFAPDPCAPVQVRRGRRSLLEPFSQHLAGSLSKRTVCVGALLDELRQLGYTGSKRSLQRFLHVQRVRLLTTREQDCEWMRMVLQGAVDRQQAKTAVEARLSDPDLHLLLDYVLTKPLKLRSRALAVLAYSKGITPGPIATFLCVTRQTVRGYISEFKTGGVAHVLDLTRKEVKKVDDPTYAGAVFKVLHTPPAAFGFNRTSWRMDDLHATLAREGVRIARVNIREIIRKAGYRFYKARKVLTSTDPDYRKKLEHITNILINLKPDEKFFSIDEFGPFAVKMQGGVALAKADHIRTVPQYQKSKGRLIVTAALELSTNQITHFYSEKKNTDEMIRMLDVLLDRYKGQRRIYFSWDAASWHGSKKFFKRVDEVNSALYQADNGTPEVELAPLPACAQFLNVIESIFSGMARAIIHNSDYQSVGDCKRAIDRYFTERNEHFRQHPQKAGKKIWGKERVPAEFNPANNCKDPRW
jgi:transposase